MTVAEATTEIISFSRGRLYSFRLARCSLAFSARRINSWRRLLIPMNRATNVAQI